MLYEAISVISQYLTRTERFMCKLSCPAMKLAVLRGSGKETVNFNEVLIYGVQTGSMKICNMAFENGASNLVTFMNEAIFGCNISAYEMALEKGIELETRRGIIDSKDFMISFCKVRIVSNTINKNDILCKAAFGGYLDICRLAIREGATEMNRCLLEAAFGGHLEVCHLAIENGATDFKGMFSRAASRGYIDICELAAKYMV